MDSRYVLTAFGTDRPGVVAAVSRIIYEIGGNLDDSTMTRLLDEFAIILLFSVRDNVDELPLKSDQLARGYFLNLRHGDSCSCTGQLNNDKRVEISLLLLYNTEVNVTLYELNNLNGGFKWVKNCLS